MLNDETGSGEHTLAKNFANKILVAGLFVEDRSEFFAANLNSNIWYLDQPEREPSAHALVVGLQWIAFESTSNLNSLRTLFRRGRSALLLALGEWVGTNEQEQQTQKENAPTGHESLPDRADSIRNAKRRQHIGQSNL